MTYCLGILLPDGLVMASDSRSNAGVDQIQTVKKLAVLRTPGERVITLLSAGNLATTQAIVTELRQAYGSGDVVTDLATCTTMYDATLMVGNKMRFVIERDGTHVRQWGDPSASMLVGGQILGERSRLFQIYSAGNFIEATPRTQFVQIGETKYGKPILDRALTNETSFAVAAKLTLLSFDATIRSNLSVAPPIDLCIYENDSYEARLTKFGSSDPFLSELRRRYAESMLELIGRLPDPPI
jgi:putative proteasome-type protease